jgi:hypothetical protein
MKFWTYWRGVFSDGDQPSFSRVASAILLIFAVGWVSSIVWHTHKLPDPGELMALGGFMTLFYITNRGTTIASDIFKK